MSPQKKSSPEPNRLRQKAESSLGSTRVGVKSMTLEEAQQLMHELHVHQVELEMQNEELHRTQLELEIARDRYATLFDLAPVGYVTLDDSGRIMEANLTFCQLTGVPRRSVLKKKFEEFIGPEDQAAFRLHVQALHRRPGTLSSEILTLCHSQHPHRVRLESALETKEPPATGATVRMTVVDVTEWEQSEAIQEEQKDLMEVVIGGVRDAIVTIDEDERIVLFNQAAETMFRCSAAEVIGQPMNRFIPEQFRKIHHLHHRQFVQHAGSTGRTSFSRKITALKADGEEFSAEVTVSQVEKKQWGKGHRKNLFAVVLRDITERRLAQEAIRQEQQFIAAVLDTAAALILVTDMEGRILRFNRACEWLTEFSFEEVRQQPFWDMLLPAEEMEEVKQYFQAFVQGRGSTFHENHWMTKKKQRRWIAWSNTLLKDSKGAPHYFVASGIDLTDQRDAQRALEQEQRFIQKVLDTAGALVVIMDPQWQVLRMNRMCEHLIPQSLENVQGRPFWEMVGAGGEKHQGAGPLREAYQSGRLPGTIESTLLDRNGRLRWIQWHTTASYRSNGEVEYFIATGSDITGRKEVERLLQQNEEQLQAILDHSPVSIWLKDLDGRYVKINRQFEKQAGVEETEMVGKTDAEIFPEQRAARLQAMDRHVLQTGQAQEFDDMDSDSLHTQHVYKFPLITPQGAPYALCGIATDITQRKQAETILQETSERLERQQEELRSLAAQLLTAQEEERRRISRDLHDDINQRLALLSLKLDTAEQSLSDRHPVKPLLKELNENVGELSDDIRHLAFQYHPSILDDLGLRSALYSLCEDFSKWEHIFITCDIPEGGGRFPQPVTICLYRVAQESLRNVTKHAGASAARLVLREDREGVFLTIHDNGRGFALQRPLPQGLGFVSMNERVRLVGGTFSVESRPGHGTTVTVSIPADRLSG